MKLKDHPIKVSRVIIICLIVSVLTGALVYATSPTQPFTINRGVYPGAPSFTVWEEDGTYFAKNAYGVIAYSGADASTVINSIIQNDVSIVVAAGKYDIASILDFSGINHISFKGEGTENTEFIWTGASSEVMFDFALSNMERGVFSDFSINGSGTTIDGLRFGGAGPSYQWDCSFSNIHIYKIGGGVALRLSYNGGTITDSHFYNIVIGGFTPLPTGDCAVGIKVGPTGGNGFFGVIIQYCSQVGVEWDSGTTYAPIRLFNPFFGGNYVDFANINASSYANIDVFGGWFENNEYGIINSASIGTVNANFFGCQLASEADYFFDFGGVPSGTGSSLLLSGCFVTLGTPKIQLRDGFYSLVIISSGTNWDIDYNGFVPSGNSTIDIYG